MKQSTKTEPGEFYAQRLAQIIVFSRFKTPVKRQAEEHLKEVKKALGNRDLNALRTHADQLARHSPALVEPLIGLLKAHNYQARRVLRNPQNGLFANGLDVTS